MALRRCLALFALCFALAAEASLPAIVDTVQSPAWRVRDNVAEPLRPGMPVQNGDRVKTGSGARVYLKLPEGSTVKLGESALLFYSVPPTTAEAVFRGALDVAAGAFRFTTSALAKLRRRDVSIRVGTATIGIRGTDVWGRARADEDLVMLIEGQVEVKSADGTSFDLKEPMATYLAPREKAPAGLAMATADEVAARAAETEIAAGAGALSGKGAWSVRLGASGTEADALALYDKARDAGFPARIVTHEAEDGRRYEVRLTGYASAARAASAATGVAGALGVEATPVR